MCTQYEINQHKIIRTNSYKFQHHQLSSTFDFWSIDFFSDPGILDIFILKFKIKIYAVHMKEAQMAFTCASRCKPFRLTVRKTIANYSDDQKSCSPS